MYEQANSSPTAKVAAGMIAVFLLPYFLYFLGRLFPEVPLPDKTLVQTLIESVVYLAITGATMYLKKPSSKDQIVKV